MRQPVLVLLLLSGCAPEAEGPYTRPQALLPDGAASVSVLDDDGTEYNGLGITADGALVLATGAWLPLEDVADTDQEKFKDADLQYAELTLTPQLDKADNITALTFSLGGEDFTSSLEGVLIQWDCFGMDPPEDPSLYGVDWESHGVLKDGTVLQAHFLSDSEKHVTDAKVDGPTLTLSTPIPSKGISAVSFVLSP